jgi:hypothetical protein
MVVLTSVVGVDILLMLYSFLVEEFVGGIKRIL